MPFACVYHCRHPLWGGNGTCIDSDPTIDATCSCGAGFLSRDGVGYPSCVPRAAVLTMYTILTASGLLTAAYMLLHAYQYRYLSSQCRGTRRAAIRMRVLVSGSGASISMGLVGLSTALRPGAIALLDPGVVQAIYCVFVPMMLFSCSMLAGFWVEALPSQLMPPHSIGAKLREAAEAHNFFSFIGWSGAGCSFVIGAMNWFFPPVWPVRISDAFAAVGAATANIVVVFVGIQMTRFIDTSSAKAPASSRPFYAKAKKNIQSQVAGLSSFGLLHSTGVTLRHLTAVGRGTPLLFNLVQAGSGFLALCFFAHFTSFTPPSKDTGTTGVRKDLRVYVQETSIAASKLPDA